LVTLDARGRAALGGLASHTRYLAAVADDGVITLTPAAIVAANWLAAREQREPATVVNPVTGVPAGTVAGAIESREAKEALDRAWADAQRYAATATVTETVHQGGTP
jgi:hypothetical protein